MKKTFFPYLFLATFVLLIFWPATHFEFINFDDNVYVTANPHVLSGLNRENIQWAFTTNLGGHWHPLTWLSLQLDSTLFGINPKAFHLENILIHTLNTLLLSYLLFRFFKNPLLACLLAALFAIHPLRIESVVWITERKDVCSLFLGTHDTLFV
ncbi:MAG: hypothetical protein IPJ69_02440 [Deltaproteobacteria bacterium]|nr:MAG: hypothetical protein IPJ69_02440 [Deltaproteobacteria bacterium]